MLRLAGVRELAPRHDGFLLDQWGVLHDGGAALPGALDCLARLREAGKRVVILSNSGRSGAANGTAMRRFGIEPHLYDAVVTAGDDARQALLERSDPFHRALGRRALVIARDEEVSLAADFGLTAVHDPASADLVLVLSLDAGRRTVGDYEALLAAARTRDLPMVCANPDVAIVRPGAVVEAPGAIARRYEAMGGKVRYHGKPDAGIYARALAVLARSGVAAPRAVALGDSIVHDVGGARNAGLACALVAAGIHREALGVAFGELPEPRRWAEFAAEAGLEPDYLVGAFVW